MDSYNKKYLYWYEFSALREHGLDPEVFGMACMLYTKQNIAKLIKRNNVDFLAIFEWKKEFDNGGVCHYSAKDEEANCIYGISDSTINFYETRGYVIKHPLGVLLTRKGYALACLATNPNLYYISVIGNSDFLMSLVAIIISVIALFT